MSDFYKAYEKARKLERQRDKKEIQQFQDGGYQKQLKQLNDKAKKLSDGVSGTAGYNLAGIKDYNQSIKNFKRMVAQSDFTQESKNKLLEAAADHTGISDTISDAYGAKTQQRRLQEQRDKEQNTGFWNKAGSTILSALAAMAGGENANNAAQVRENAKAEEEIALKANEREAALQKQINDNYAKYAPFLDRAKLKKSLHDGSLKGKELKYAKEDFQAADEYKKAALANEVLNNKNIAQNVKQSGASNAHSQKEKVKTVISILGNAFSGGGNGSDFVAQLSRYMQSEEDNAKKQQKIVALLKQSGYKTTDGIRAEDLASYLTESETRNINLEQAQETAAAIKRISTDHPVLSTGLVLATAPLKTLGTGETIAKTVEGWLKDEKVYMDANDPIYSFNNLYSNVVSTTAKNLKNNYGDFASEAYQFGVTLADNGIRAAATMLLGGGKVAEAVSLVSMGLGVMNDTAVELTNLGMDAKSAGTLSFIAGGAEVVTEMVPLDNLLGMLKNKSVLNKQQIIRGIVTQILTEGTEEGMSDVINDVADVVYEMVSVNPSRRQLEIEQLMKKEGLSYEEAYRQWTHDHTLEYIKDVAGGMLSGGIMAGGAMGTNAIINNTAAGANIMQYGRGNKSAVKAEIQGIIDSAAKKGQTINKKQANVIRLNQQMNNGGLSTGNAVYDTLINNGLNSTDESVRKQAQKLAVMRDQNGRQSLTGIGKLQNLTLRANTNVSIGVASQIMDEVGADEHVKDVLMSALRQEELSKKDLKLLLNDENARNLIADLSGVRLDEDSNLDDIEEAIAATYGNTFSVIDNSTDYGRAYTVAAQLKAEGEFGQDKDGRVLGTNAMRAFYSHYTDKANMSLDDYSAMFRHAYNLSYAGKSKEEIAGTMKAYLDGADEATQKVCADIVRAAAIAAQDDKKLLEAHKKDKALKKREQEKAKAKRRAEKKAQEAKEREELARKFKEMRKATVEGVESAMENTTLNSGENVNKHAEGLTIANESSAESKKALREQVRSLKEGGGAVIYKKAGTKLSGTQAATIAAYEYLGKKRGLVYVFTDDTSETIGGEYKDGVITVSLASAASMTAVAGHELGHYLAQNYAEEYKQLSGYVQTALEAHGESMAARVLEVQALYERQTGQKLTYTEAVEEIVNNALFSVDIKSAEFETFIKEHTTLAQRILDAIHDFLRDLSAFFGTVTGIKEVETLRGDLEYMQEVAERVEEILAKNANEVAKNANKVGKNENNSQKNSTTAESDVKFLISDKFAEEYDNWNKKDPTVHFYIGSTSKALSKIGVDNKPIIWDSSKIIGIRSDHGTMTDDIIKQVPQILEDPIVIMQSKTFNTRVTIFGEVYVNDNEPVLAVLIIKPEDESVEINQLKIVSAYRKKGAQNFINSSDILYIDSNKKRVAQWSQFTGLQLPVNSQSYNSTNSIPDNSEKSNTKKLVLDRDYMQAARNGDEAKAAEYVEQAAKEWGAFSDGKPEPIDLYHGTKSFGFTEFDLRKMDDGRSIFLTSDETTAQTYSGVLGTRRIGADYSKYSAEDVAKELNKRADEFFKEKYYTLNLKQRNEIINRVNDNIEKLREFLETYPEFWEYDHISNEMIKELLEVLKTYDYEKLGTKLQIGGYNRTGSHTLNSSGIDIEQFCKDAYILKSFINNGSTEIIVRERNPYFHTQSYSVEEAKNMLQRGEGNYSLYAKFNNPLVVDCKGDNWNAIDFKVEVSRYEIQPSRYYPDMFEVFDKDAMLPKWINGQNRWDTREQAQAAIESLPADEKPYYRRLTKTRQISEYAQQAGYDGVVFKNIRDNGGRGMKEPGVADYIAVAFDSAQVKSADPITYDDNGEIIPLSERFSDDKDIRYSVKDIEEFNETGYNVINTTGKRGYDDLKREVMTWDADRYLDKVRCIRLGISGRFYIYKMLSNERRDIIVFRPNTSLARSNYYAIRQEYSAQQLRRPADVIKIIRNKRNSSNDNNQLLGNGREKNRINDRVDNRPLRKEGRGDGRGTVKDDSDDNLPKGAKQLVYDTALTDTIHEQEAELARAARESGAYKSAVSRRKTFGDKIALIRRQMSPTFKTPTYQYEKVAKVADDFLKKYGITDQLDESEKKAFITALHNMYRNIDGSYGLGYLDNKGNYQKPMENAAELADEYAAQAINMIRDYMTVPQELDSHLLEIKQYFSGKTIYLPETHWQELRYMYGTIAEANKHVPFVRFAKATGKENVTIEDSWTEIGLDVKLGEYVDMHAFVDLLQKIKAGGTRLNFFDSFEDDATTEEAFNAAVFELQNTWGQVMLENTFADNTLMSVEKAKKEDEKSHKRSNRGVAQLAAYKKALSDYMKYSEKSVADLQKAYAKENERTLATLRELGAALAAERQSNEALKNDLGDAKADKVFVENKNRKLTKTVEELTKNNATLAAYVDSLTEEKKQALIDYAEASKKLRRAEKKVETRDKWLEAEKEHRRQRVAELQAQKDLQRFLYQQKMQEKRNLAIERKRKTELKGKLRRKFMQIASLAAANDKKRHVPNSLINSVKDMLNAFNIYENGTKSKVRFDTYLSRIGTAFTRATKDENYESVYGGYSEFINNQIQYIRDKYGIKEYSLSDFSVEELEDINDLVNSVIKFITEGNRTFAENIKENIDELQERTVTELRESNAGKKQEHDRKNSLKQLLVDNMKPVYFFRQAGSTTLEKLFMNVYDGENTWANDNTEARDKEQELRKKYHYSGWNQKEKHSFKLASNQTLELNLQQIMTLYALSRREDAQGELVAWDHLLEGGVRKLYGTEARRGFMQNRKLKLDEEIYKFTEKDIQTIVNTLTNEQKGFVQEAQEFLSVDVAKWGNAVSEKLYDVHLFKGKIYFPMQSDKQWVEEKEKKTTGARQIKNFGASQALIKHANNPLVLGEFNDVFGNHIDEMALYHAFVLPLEDLQRVYGYYSTKKNSSVRHLLGRYNRTYIDQLLQDLNGGVKASGDIDFGGRMVSRWKKVSVSLNSSVIIQQPSAIGRAFAYIEPKYFKPALPTEKNLEEMMVYAPVARIKSMGYFDVDLGRTATEFINENEYSGLKEKGKAIFTDRNYRENLLTIGAEKADELTWAQIWSAAKQKAKAQGFTGEAQLEKAGEIFTECIRMTQVYDSVFSRSGNMRKKGFLANAATAFMSEPTTAANMLVDAFSGLKSGRTTKKFAASVTASVLTATVINAMLKAVVQSLRHADDDDDIIEQYPGEVLGNILDDVNPISYIPILKDVYAVFAGNDVERPDMTLISDFAGKLKKVLADPKDGARWVDLAATSAQIFGIPTVSVVREYKQVSNLVSHIFTDDRTTVTAEGILEQIHNSIANSFAISGQIAKSAGAKRFLQKSTNNYTLIYRLIQSGNKDEAMRRFNIMKKNDEKVTDKALQSNIRKLLQSDPHIIHAAELWNRGKAKEARAALDDENLKNFDMNDRLQATITVAKSLTKSAPSTEASDKDYTEDFDTGAIKNTEYAQKAAQGILDADYYAVEENYNALLQMGYNDKQVQKAIISIANKAGKGRENYYSATTTRSLKNNTLLNDSDVSAAAEATHAGKIEERIELQNKLISKGYTMNEVGAAISKVEKKLYPSKKKEEGTERTYYTYRTSDVSAYLKAGDTKSAANATKVLINEYKKAGKTEDAAKEAIRKAITAEFKETYRKANDKERERIRQLMYASGAYKSGFGVVSATKWWLK